MGMKLTIRNIGLQMLRILTCLYFMVCISLKAEARVQRHTIEAETARLLSGASVVADNESSKGYLVNLCKARSGCSIH